MFGVGDVRLSYWMKFFGKKKLMKTGMDECMTAGSEL